MTLLFSPSQRARTTSKRYNEPMYAFLDASAWPSVGRVREFWEGWFSQYDDVKKPAKDLIARFGSLRAILDAPIEELQAIKGIGPVTSVGQGAGHLLQRTSQAHEVDVK